MKTVTINSPTNDATLNISLDTIALKKQALVFCNTKRGAESQAEKVAHKIKTENVELQNLAEKALKILPSPTKQCKRLALCLKKGIAFHHAGLHSKQRELIENNFREGSISIICSTPTLAMGMDLPAFRVLIRDLKRFSANSWGMSDIPVLEYEQMAGRAGRPGKEKYGEAIIFAETAEQATLLSEKYVHGEPEEIYSKLAVEPVLRTYVLSLIASEFVTTHQGLYDFFEGTFYAQQYGNILKLKSILDAMVNKLEEWEFLTVAESAGDFIAANSIRDGALKATLVGRRVAELYLDPLTANFIITCLKRASSIRLSDFSFLHMLSSCLEMRPLLRPRVKEVEDIVARTVEYGDSLLSPEPVQYSSDYDEFLMSFKTSLFMLDWIEEIREDALLERYAIRPGEIHAKLDRADWLLYASEEMARLLNFQELRAPLARMRLRMKHGAKEELLPLLKLKNIGRVRARKLCNNRMKTLQDIKSADLATLVGLLGQATALDIKKQVGQEFAPEKIKVKAKKRKGQLALTQYGKTD